MQAAHPGDGHTLPSARAYVGHARSAEPPESVVCLAQRLGDTCSTERLLWEGCFPPQANQSPGAAKKIAWNRYQPLCLKLERQAKQHKQTPDLAIAAVLKRWDRAIGEQVLGRKWTAKVASRFKELAAGKVELKLSKGTKGCAANGFKSSPAESTTQAAFVSVFVNNHF